MRLLKAEVSNFSSYNHLVIDFNNQGLALVYGDTGSGKSTLLDIVSWILWGITAKDGNVDDVKSWTAGNSLTSGSLFIELSNQTIEVVRKRGKPSENDLHWISDKLYRGKDISETQKLLNQLLNVDYETYSIAAYYNEYSLTRNFFNSTAKHRKELFESLADLSFSLNLQEKLTIEKKETKTEQSNILLNINKLLGQQEQLKKSQISLNKNAVEWNSKHADQIKKLEILNQTFEDDKKQQLVDIVKKSQVWDKQKTTDLAALKKQRDDAQKILNSFTSICPTCGGVNHSARDAERLVAELDKKLYRLDLIKNPYVTELQQAEQTTNKHAEQLEYLKIQQNPFIKSKDVLINDLHKCEAALTKEQNKVESVKHKLVSLTQLNDLNIEFKALILNNNILYVQNETNRYLETYFDAELRVDFEVNADNLAVTINKNGYECKYSQLSKGQKCLLKLCFSVAVMGVAANKIGMHFNALFFDEALDGLDVNLKIKAFGLFSELAEKHETIFVIDHSTELQNLFNKKYYVRLNNDNSVLKEE